MKRSHLLLFCFSLFTCSLPVHAERGRIVGEYEVSIPGWFKTSFLDLKDDALEAKLAQRKLMVFMHIDRCPYCTRMLEENFIHGDNKAYIQKNFDVIALNIRGDREVSWHDGNIFIEKKLAQSLGVIATPAILFLDNQARKIYQMNGYRKPAEFRKLMEYIRSEQYQKMRFDEFLVHQQQDNYQFRDHALFIDMPDPAKYNGPLAVIIEDKVCLECDDFHNEVLQHPEVLAELKKFKVVRLDARSTTPILVPTGKRTTAKEWVHDLKLDYRPATLLFDQGKLIDRIEGRLYHFHYREYLRYVSGQHYLQYPGFLPYLGNRQNEILKAGINVDVSR